MAETENVEIRNPIPFTDPIHEFSTIQLEEKAAELEEKGRPRPALHQLLHQGGKTRHRPPQTQYFQTKNCILNESTRMDGRALSFNTSTAHVWGQLVASLEKKGIQIPTLDSQLAATAQRHGLTMVTRNVADFENAGVKLLNPFSP